MTSFNDSLHLVEVDLHYYQAGDGPVAAHLRAAYLDNDQITLTTIHEKINGETDSFDIWRTEGAAAFDLADGESLTILARQQGSILAAGVYEVSQAATAVGLILLPRATSNLLLHQIEVDFWQLTEIDAAGQPVQQEQEEEGDDAAGC